MKSTPILKVEIARVVDDEGVESLRLHVDETIEVYDNGHSSRRVVDEEIEMPKVIV